MKISRFFEKAKDGGPSSPVEGYFMIEIKGLLSIAILRFNKGGREEFHTHAFNAFTWFLKGRLIEEDVDGTIYRYSKNLFPKITKRGKNHRVLAEKDSWCFTLRGPWVDTWTETDKSLHKVTQFTHKRKVLKVDNLTKSSIL